MSHRQTVKGVTHLQLTFLCCLLFYWVHNVYGIYQARRYSDRLRIPCEYPGSLPNGFSGLRRRNSMLIHHCDFGYKMFGERRTPCNHGKWIGNRPVCATNTCTSPAKSPENGRLQYFDLYRIGVFCSEGYQLAGNSLAYCNGTDWDRPLGYCRPRPGKISHECDFESDDICGWVTDKAEGFFWKRTMATNVFTSFHTGPQHDHTTMRASGGHYMLMESFGPTTTPVALTSPIYERAMSLKTACCFQFYYFMYGAGVGNLRIYIKPFSIMLSDVIRDKENFMKFNKSGNQSNTWNEAHFSIDEMEEDFQIVFVADGAKNHLSDIAIDDVKIMFGTECKSLDNHDDEPDDSAEYEPTTTEQSLYDTLSCVSRCGVESNRGIMVNATHLIGLCSCHDSCIVDDDCCPDYTKVCLDAPESTTVDVPDIVTTTFRSEVKSTTTTSKEIVIRTPLTTPTTTTTTTTTTKKPTTASTTTTTTTRKPTTTATTTRQPTTTTTTPTTTTTTTTPKPKLSSTKRTTPTTTTPKTTTQTPKTTTETTTTTRTSTIPTTVTTSTKISTATIKTTPPTQAYSTRYTQPVLTVTTSATINHKATAVLITEQPTKNHQQIKSNKHTWEWHPKPESNPRETLVLVFIFGILLIAICITVIYRQKEALKALWLRKTQTNEDGAQDCNSIIANFAPVESTTNNSHGNTARNAIKLSFPSIIKGRLDKRGSTGEAQLLSENYGDTIQLL